MSNPTVLAHVVQKPGLFAEQVPHFEFAKHAEQVKLVYDYLLILLFYNKVNNIKCKF